MLILALISLASGVLMAHSRWIAKVGMTFLHKEFNFTKIWWQGAIGVFILFLVLLLIHSLVHKHLTRATARAIHLMLLLAAAVGLFYTYQDFTHDLSHKLLGWRFHTGFYLILAGWIIICLFFLLSRAALTTGEGKKVTTTA